MNLGAEGRGSRGPTSISGDALEPPRGSPGRSLVGGGGASRGCSDGGRAFEYFLSEMCCGFLATARFFLCQGCRLICRPSISWE